MRLDAFVFRVVHANVARVVHANVESRAITACWSQLPRTCTTTELGKQKMQQKQDNTTAARHASTLTVVAKPCSKRSATCTHTQRERESRGSQGRGARLSDQALI